MADLNLVQRKKLEIIVEAPLLNHILDVFDRAAVTGYTVVPTLAGCGRRGPWREGQLSNVGRMIMVICITDESRMQQVLEPVHKVLGRQIGIMTVTDVAVVQGA